MSIGCMMHVWWNSPSSGNDRLVLLAIADEADDEGKNSWPSIRRIAEKARCHTSTVVRCVENLEGAGELEVIRPSHPKPGVGNKYRVIMGSVPPADQLRARYADIHRETGSARKMRAEKLSTTARISSKNRAHFARELRASDARIPLDPSLDPPNSYPQGHNFTGAFHCDECAGGWVEVEGGVARCPNQKKAS